MQGTTSHTRIPQTVPPHSPTCSQDPSPCASHSTSSNPADARCVVRPRGATCQSIADSCLGRPMDSKPHYTTASLLFCTLIYSLHSQTNSPTHEPALRTHSPTHPSGGPPRPSLPFTTHEPRPSIYCIYTGLCSNICTPFTPQ